MIKVYPVREDTLLLKRNLERQDLEGKKVLEIGTGNGENTITAAKKNAETTATDINTEAIQHVNERLEKQNLQADLIQTNLFKDIDDKFDLVVFNPPYLKGEKGIGDEKMWRGGKTGLETPEKYLNQVTDYLKEDGVAWIILSNNTNHQKLMEKHGLAQIDEKKLWFETIHLLKLEQIF